MFWSAKEKVAWRILSQMPPFDEDIQLDVITSCLALQKSSALLSKDAEMDMREMPDAPPFDEDIQLDVITSCLALQKSSALHSKDAEMDVREMPDAPPLPAVVTDESEDNSGNRIDPMDDSGTPDLG